METLKLSQKYQIVVPRGVRAKMGLKAGMKMKVLPLNDKLAVLLKYPQDHVEALKGLGREVWQALGGGTRYIKTERSSWSKKSA